MWIPLNSSFAVHINIHVYATDHEVPLRFKLASRSCVEPSKKCSQSQGLPRSHYFNMPTDVSVTTFLVNTSQVTFVLLQSTFMCPSCPSSFPSLPLSPCFLVFPVSSPSFCDFWHWIRLMTHDWIPGFEVHWFEVSKLLLPQICSLRAKAWVWVIVRFWKLPNVGLISLVELVISCYFLRENTFDYSCMLADACHM